MSKKKPFNYLSLLPIALVFAGGLMTWGGFQVQAQAMEALSSMREEKPKRRRFFR
jgi:hypothetical protein